MFKQAVKHEAKLRMAIAGPSGSGKTYTSLAVGAALANGGRIAMVDTEHGSASKYADIFDFDVLEMAAPFHPERFIEAIKAAEQAGYDVLILDSLSHAWSGAGGLLDEVDKIAKRMRNPNSFAAWKDATPIQNAFIEAIVAARLHIIATMRSKQEYVLQEDNRGKQVPRKVGMAPIQRDGFEYEFDVFLDMDIENNAIVSKTRCPALTGQVFNKPGTELARTLQEWLTGAKPPTQEEWLAQALEATSLDAFGHAAYRLDYAHNVFESEQRLKDWYGFVAGDFDTLHNGVVLHCLSTYCNAVADGSKVKAAAEAARTMFRVETGLANEEEE